MPIRIVTLVSLLLFSLGAQAGLYKWVDADGQVHYGDQPVSTQESAKVEKVQITDGFAIKDVDQLFPIRYTGKGSSRAVHFDKFTLRLPVSAGHRIEIGRVSVGDDCRFADVLYWDSQERPIEGEGMAAMVRQTFDAYGYRYSSSIGTDPLLLSAEIVDLQVDSCLADRNDRLTRDAVYIKVRWTLQDIVRDKVIYTGTSEGSVDQRNLNPRRDGAAMAIDRALREALVNLLAEKDFVAQLDSESVLKEDARLIARAPVFVQYGKHDGDFRSQVNDLERLAVTVKTEDGHGSGVLLDQHGYVLTNAHVVEQNAYVTVRMESGEYRAKVLTRQPGRDVALVKIVDEARLPQKPPTLRISRDGATQGDEIYVIGTPLDLSLDETITKGIVSAKRMRDGMPFLQTDAAVNPGNSGGPVFDAKGELVAITVAGLFTSGGASLNINYLIPIGEAMKSLNIVAAD